MKDSFRTNLHRLQNELGSQGSTRAPSLLEYALILLPCKSGATKLTIYDNSSHHLQLQKQSMHKYGPHLEVSGCLNVNGKLCILVYGTWVLILNEALDLIVGLLCRLKTNLAQNLEHILNSIWSRLKNLFKLKYVLIHFSSFSLC